MDGVTVVNPLLEKVMKETALDKVKQKFILKSAENPDIMEAVDELYKSMAFVDGSFRDGNFNKDAHIDTDNVENYILGSRLKYLMNVLDYSIMFEKIIDEDTGESVTYTSSIKKDHIENLIDDHEYILYVYDDTITTGDITNYIASKTAREEEKMAWMNIKNNKLANKARNRLVKSMIFIDSDCKDVSLDTPCTSCFRKPIKGKLLKRYLNHCKYPGREAFKSADNNKKYLLAKYYDGLEAIEMEYC